MSTHTTDSAPPATGEAKRFKPHQLVIAIGVFMGVFTLLSGIIPVGLQVVESDEFGGFLLAIVIGVTAIS